MEIKKAGSVFKITYEIDGKKLYGTVTKFETGGFYQLELSLQELEDKQILTIYSSVNFENKTQNVSFNSSQIDTILQNLPDLSKILTEIIQNIKTLGL